MPDTPLRGRRGRDRRIAERVATDFAARHARPAPETEVDFDVAAVDAEVEDARRPAPPARKPAVAAQAGAAAAPAGRAPATACPTCRLSRRCSPRPGPSPPSANGWPAVPTTRPVARRTGRHVGLVSVPHGAKSYLAAALAQVAGGERLVWVARDAEIGDRVAEELGAWLGDPEAVAILEPRTALAYERSELIADETAARVAALAAWQSGRARVLVASVQALLQHTIAPADLPAAPRELRLGSRVRQDALLRELFDLGYVPVAEVAGRGESARRGGIVDVFPPSLPLPIRIEFFGDEIDSLRSFDPTDQRTVGHPGVGRPAAGVRVPPAAGRRRRPSAIASAVPPPASRSVSPRTSPGSTPSPSARPATVRAEASRALAVGDAAEVWAAHLAPATGLDHIDPGTLLVLDEPGDLAEAAAFLWRQADERRAELVAAGELPKDWPPTYLPPRDWKGRLVASRTLELTWESEPPEDAAMARGGLSSGDPFGWREPVLPPGRAGRIAEAVEAWRADGARIVLASDQAPRLADLLGEAGHEVAVVGRVAEAPPPGAIVAHRAKPQRRLHRRPGRPRLRHRPRAVRDRPDPAATGPAARRPPRHPRSPDAGRPRRPHRPRRRPLRADAPPRRRRRGPRLPRAVVRRRRPDLRPGRADRARHALCRRRAAGAVQARRDRMAARQAARPQGGRRPRRGPPRAVRLARRCAGPRLRARHAVAVRDGGLVPVRGDDRPAARRRRGQGGHGADPADGPARRRRRRLRQDRGRAAGRVQGDPGRQAGRGPRSHDGPRRPARRDLLAAVRRVPARGPAAVALRPGGDPGDDHRRPRRRHASTSSSARTAC